MKNIKFDLEESLLQVKKYLPLQGPLKNFVQQNILNNFMDLNFEKGISLASKIYNSNTHMNLSFYRNKYLNKEITDLNLQNIINKKIKNTDNYNKNIIFNMLHYFEPLDADFKTQKKSLRNIINNNCSQNINHIINPILFRCLSYYTDQGISLWQCLDKNKTFLDAIKELLDAHLPLAYFVSNKLLKNSLELPVDNIITSMLNKIIIDKNLYNIYIFESLMSHTGWSGMIYSLEKNSKLLNQKIHITLKEVLAFKLVLEYFFIQKYKNNNFNQQNISQEYHNKQSDFKNFIIKNYDKQKIDKKLLNITIFDIQQIWHEAMELNYYEKISKIICTNNNLIKNEIKFQAIFCIDAREESLRRWLESLSDNIETFGTPGFFNIDSFLLDEYATQKEKICPLGIEPKHIIIRKNKFKNNNYLALANYVNKYGSHNIFIDFIATHTLGHLSLLNMFKNILWPQKKILSNKQKETIDNFHFSFDINNKSYKHYQIGYTDEEMSLRVAKTLISIGLSTNFAPLIFFIAHGSTSNNNPHFAAYNCGACSGHSGVINSIILAQMANKKEVRDIIADKYKIIIPDSCVFIAALHNTCTDEYEFFDTKNLSISHKNYLKEFKKILNKACMHNAKERCEKFALVPKNITLQKALEEAKKRSLALFEPRAELGNATNALAIVARRERTKGKNFNRRSFLQSYDPNQDKDGLVLQDILNALVPVSGGINLAYYFSKIDPSIYGCGSKISHNVVSLLGVGNGTDDDLRTGLPIQMTEIHDPIRLLLVVEQEQEILLNIIRNNQSLYNWIFNDWMKLACLDIKEDKIFHFCIKTNQFIINS